MERILKSACYRVNHNGDYNRSFQTRLRRNYRSHPEIVNLFNHLFYNNQLLPLAKENVELICKKWSRLPNTKYPILFHSVDGIAETENNSTSIYNWREIDVVIHYVKDLLKINFKDFKITEDDIGIISPYKLQYIKIKNALADHDLSKITIGSPETFQGSEKPIIIVSFVRSKTRALGFLTNEKRLNVTISRPKSMLILIGNAETLKINSNFKFIIDSCIAHKSFIKSAFAEKPDTLDDLLKKLKI
ncbi:putative helicase mov-10-B.1 [Teleopsis dalmanni]|uniref:putative helicase mov-10-B.1 n=1 Tax=Teleopsis dalmanni TaxID=139649 RepID=UPI0018CE7C69|nr:putative helicase mov-10-B.1 [Teleopsis dalmanni]